MFDVKTIIGIVIGSSVVLSLLFPRKESKHGKDQRDYPATNV